MRQAGALLLLLALLFPVGAARAAFVTDKLAAGLYRDPDDETPVRVLISGTPLEILERKGRFCQVRLGDGDGGWLKCRYASDEKPARTMLLEAQARNGRLLEQMEDTKRQLEEKQLQVQALELRLQAAQRVVEGQGGPAEIDSAPGTATEMLQENEPEKDAGKWSCEHLPAALSGAVGGFLFGALLFWWRCRRRFGGLRI